MNRLEKMSDFFEKRAELYDEHMLTEVEGCKEGYRIMASLVPANTAKLLDLGCGTGLELDEIFSVKPDISVTGIDLCSAMLEKLKEKHRDKNICLFCEDYFAYDFPEENFDCVISFQTMHHFPKEKKLSLYKKIYSCLKSGGVYIEGDYMVETQEEEDHWFSENERLRKENGITDEEYYHYDTPCTVDNQIFLFKYAGFVKAAKVFRQENTTIIIAEKQ